MGGPSYHGRTHAPGGTDPIPPLPPVPATTPWLWAVYAGGGFTSIANTASGNLAPGSLFDGTELFDHTAPAAVTWLYSGVFTISATVSINPSTLQTVNGYFDIYLQLNARTNQGSQSRSTLAITSQRVTIGYVVNCAAVEVGDTLKLSVTSFDGSTARDYACINFNVQQHADLLH